MAGEQKWHAFGRIVCRCEDGLHSPNPGGENYLCVTDDAGRVVKALSTLEAENAGLRAKAELADEIRRVALLVQVTSPFVTDWCARYDALAASRTTEEGS